MKDRIINYLCFAVGMPILALAIFFTSLGIAYVWVNIGSLYLLGLKLAVLVLPVVLMAVMCIYIKPEVQDE